MPGKRAKIDARYLIGLRRVAFATIRAVLDAMPELGPEYDVRNLRYDLDRARDEVLDGVLHTVDLPLDDGSVYKWHFGRPQAVLRKLTNGSDVLKRVLRRTPNSVSAPWDVLHYHDEVTAGHLLAPVHSRSFTTFRFSFEQLGRHLLTCEEMWIEYAILRSPVLERVVGGMSYVVGILMHLFFTCSSEGFTTLSAQGQREHSSNALKERHQPQR